MSLSEDERSRLGEIEAHTRATDPAFVRSLDLAFAHRRHRQMNITVWCLLFVGAWMLATGLTSAQGLISLGNVVALFGAVLTCWSAATIIRRRAWRRGRPG